MVDRLVRSVRGKYTEESLGTVFRSFDRDGNGLMGTADLRQVISKLSENLTDGEINDIIREADMDGDGQINYEEFVRRMMVR